MLLFVLPEKDVIGLVKKPDSFGIGLDSSGRSDRNKVSRFSG